MCLGLCCVCGVQVVAGEVHGRTPAVRLLPESELLELRVRNVFVACHAGEGRLRPLG